MEYQKFLFEIDEAISGKRLDIFVSEKIGQTRSFVKNLIQSGQITLDNRAVKAGSILKVGHVVSVNLPLNQETSVQPLDMPIQVLYQDEFIAAINKPQGLAVHPSVGHKNDTLVNALLYNLDKLSSINGTVRPGIVHRLDKDTSGVMVVAKTDDSHLELSKQFEHRTVKKKYIGVVSGIVAVESGVVNLPIGRSKTDRKKMSVVEGGRLSTTKYKVLQRFDKSTLVEFEILTGRTHQIRVHCKYLGHPIVGDVIYGSQKLCKNQLLHSLSITICHPKTKQYLTFEAALPKYFEEYLQQQRVVK